MRRRGWLSLTLLGAAVLPACGRINYEPVPLRASGAGGASGDPGTGGAPGDPPDAEPPDPDASSPEAPLMPAICTPATPFAAPAPLVIQGLEMPDNSLYGPRLAPDGLTLYFSQTRGTPFRDEDIYRATRPSLGAAFASPVRVDVLDSVVFDGAAFPVADDLEIYFSSDRPGGSGKRDLWVSKRAQPSGTFGAPTPVPGVSSSANDQNPSLTADGLLLFFASDRDGGDDIFASFRVNRSAAFSRPVKVAGLNTAAKDTAPFILPDGLAIYFTSDRAGTRGGLDVYSASRANRLVGFEPPTPMTGISSNGQDEDPALSPDGRELFFASGRNGKAVSLFRAVRCP